MVIELFLEWVSGAPVSRRVEAAHALAEGLLRSDLTLEEREDLVSAMTALAEDASPCVRHAVAKALGASRGAPRHIALALASDTDLIAVEVLSRSSVLHDVELVELLQSSTTAAQVAIAGRPWVSEKLASSIVNTACLEAVIELLENTGAEIPADTLHKAARTHGSNSKVRGILAEREDLGAHTRLMLVEKLGSALGKFVTEKKWLTEKRVDQVVFETCERASILFAADISDLELQHVVKDKMINDELTVSYLLRATCMGNIGMFARALSELAALEIGRVEAALRAGNHSAFRAIYDRAGMPGPAFTLFAEAISAWRKVLSNHTTIATERMAVMVMNDVVASYSRKSEHLEDELLGMLRRWTADASRHYALSKVQQASHAMKQVEQASTVKLSAGEAVEFVDLAAQMAEELAVELALDAELLASEVTQPDRFENDNQQVSTPPTRSLEEELREEIADELSKNADHNRVSENLRTAA